MTITVVTSPQVESAGAVATNSMTVANGDYIALSIATNTNFGSSIHVITKSSGTATIGTVVSQAVQQSGGQHSHHSVPVTGDGTLILSISNPDAVRTIVRPLILTGVDSGDPYGLVAQGGSSTNAIDVGGTAEAADSVLVVGGTEWNDLGNPTSSDLTDFDADNGAGGSMSYGAGWKTVGAPGAVTGNLDAAGGGAADWDWVVVEYRASGGGGEPAGGLTPDPAVLVGLFRRIRWLPVWQGSWGAEIAVGDLTVDAGVFAGVLGLSTVTPEPSAVTRTLVGVHAASTVTPEPSVVARALAGVVARSTVTPEWSVASQTFVGVVARSGASPEWSFTSNAFVGAHARSQPSADTDLTVVSLAELGVVLYSTYRPEPTAAARVLAGVVARSTVIPELSFTSSSFVGVHARSLPAVDTDVTVAALARIGVHLRGIYQFAAVAEATVRVGVHARSSPTITVTSTSRTLLGVHTRTDGTIVISTVSRVLIGGVLYIRLTPLAVIVIEQIDRWSEPRAIVYTEPSEPTWREQSAPPFIEPDQPTWREPPPTKGAS